MKKIILLMVLLMGSVSGYNLNFEVKDINTMQPLNATLTVYYRDNEALFSFDTFYSGEDGLIYFPAASNEYFYNITKTGYFPLLDQYENITEDTAIYHYATPISQDGIIRFRMGDLTPFEHEYCIYYQENSRLQGCYSSNETATLIINKNYTFRPTITDGDLLSNPEASKSFFSSIVNFAYPLVIILVLAFLTLAGLSYALRR